MTANRAFTFCSLLALGALGAFAASGCAQQDYYCDATGCYNCDGVGCRTVPPTHPTCSSDRDCATGAHCTTAGCVYGCTTSPTDSCLARMDGTHCDPATMMCLGPTETVPPPHSGRCVTAADCGAGQICVAGYCQTGTTTTCDASHPCPTDQTCVSGSCVPSSSLCQFNYQCGAGRVCVNQHCATSCAAAGATCPTGTTCNATTGACEAVPPTTCTTDTDCGTGRVCIASACYDACTTDAMCGAGRYCAGGACQIDNRPQPFCTSNAMCMAGHPCIGGVCRSPCTTSADCARFDVQFNFCDTTPGHNYCVTTNEVTAMCSSAAMCTSGQSCVDGLCR